MLVALVRAPGLPRHLVNLVAALLVLLAVAPVAARGRAAPPIDRGLAGFLCLAAAGLWVPAARTAWAAEPVAPLYAVLWAVYSILTSLPFVGPYLCLRWMTGNGCPVRQILLFMIGFATIRLPPPIGERSSGS